jgi:hypothetical protein
MQRSQTSMSGRIDGTTLVAAVSCRGICGGGGGRGICSGVCVLHLMSSCHVQE